MPSVHKAFQCIGPVEHGITQTTGHIHCNWLLLASTRRSRNLSKRHSGPNRNKFLACCYGALSRSLTAQHRLCSGGGACARDRGRHGRGEQAREQANNPLMAGMLFPFQGRTAAAPRADEIRPPQRRPRHAQNLLYFSFDAGRAQRAARQHFDRTSCTCATRMAKRWAIKTSSSSATAMERMCYDVQAVQTFRRGVVRDIVPVVSRHAAERQAPRHRLAFRLYDNEVFTPGGDPTPCGKALFATAQKAGKRHGRRHRAEFFPHDVPKQRPSTSCARPNKWGGGYCAGCQSIISRSSSQTSSGTSGDVDVGDARGRSRAQRLPDALSNRFALETRLRRHGDRRNALDEHGVFAWPYLGGFQPGDATPLPARAREAR